MSTAGTIEQWWAAGTVAPVKVDDAERAIFVRRMGSGPSVTLLHGFPSSSFDWAAVAADLANDYSLLMPDLLGFGASERPVGHQYSLHEQADLVEALWALEGITRTTLVAHDYAATVAQELLARRSEGRLGVELERVYLLNGGIYPDLHRAEPVQLALLDPGQGPAVSAAMTAEAIAQALKPTFAPTFDAEQSAEDIWLSNAKGEVNLHETIAYILDRRTHEQRWVTALETTDLPLTFVWGMLDPISGAHMIERVHARIPAATVIELPDVGHWPSIEAPQTVAATIRVAT